MLLSEIKDGSAKLNDYLGWQPMFVYGGDDLVERFGVLMEWAEDLCEVDRDYLELWIEIKRILVRVGYVRRVRMDIKNGCDYWFKIKGVPYGAVSYWDKWVIN